MESYGHQSQREGPLEDYDDESDEDKSGYLDIYPGGSGTITDDETDADIDVEIDVDTE